MSKLKTVGLILGIFIAYFWLGIILSLYFGPVYGQLFANSLMILAGSFLVVDRRVKIGVKNSINITIICLLIIIGILYISSYLYEVVRDSAFQSYSQQLGKMDTSTMVLFAVFFAPFAEEFLFRGVVFGYLRKIKIPFAISALISALVFTLMHGTLIHIVPAFIMATFLCIVYEYTHNIFYCVCFHSLYNTMAILLGNIVPQYNFISVLAVFLLVITVLYTSYEEFVVKRSEAIYR